MSEFVEVNAQGAIDANDKAANNSTLLSLHLFHKIFMKMRNQMVIR